MAGMAYLKVFFDWLGPLEQLNDEEAGRLFRAALLYARDGIDVPLSGNERFVFSLLRAQIDRDKASWKAKSEILSEAGKRGAAARWDNSQAKPGQAKDGQAKSNIARYGLNSQEKEKDQDKDQEKKNTQYNSADAQLSPVVRYFFQRYEQHTREKHPFVSQEKLEEIQKVLEENDADEYFVDEYFGDEEHRGLCGDSDCRIYHFASPVVLQLCEARIMSGY